MQADHRESSESWPTCEGLAQIGTRNKGLLGTSGVYGRCGRPADYELGGMHVGAPRYFCRWHIGDEVLSAKARPGSWIARLRDDVHEIDPHANYPHGRKDAVLLWLLIPGTIAILWLIGEAFQALT